VRLQHTRIERRETSEVYALSTRGYCEVRSSGSIDYINCLVVGLQEQVIPLLSTY